MGDLSFVTVIIGTVGGLASEALLYTIIFAFAMGLKRARITLFFLVLASCSLGLMFPHTVWAHVSRIVLMYLSLAALFKAHYSTLILVASADLFLGVISGLLFYAIFIPTGNLLFFMAALWIIPALVAFLLRAQIRKIYLFFQNHWDRKAGLKIKSVTLRHFCVIGLCLLFLFANFAARDLIARI